MSEKVKRASPRKVFLSHSSRNHAFATKLAGALQAHGIRVWYSKTHIRGAQDWHDEIGKALEECDWFVLVLSPASAKARWVKHELLYALRTVRYDDHIVPVLLRTCRHQLLSWTLDGFQRIDFRQNFDDGCRELLRIWGIDYGSGSGLRRRGGRQRA